MKKIASIIILLSVLFLFSACNRQSEDLELAVCGSYGVPGMMCYDLKGQSFQLEVIERDPKGRILYSFTAYNSVTEKQETAYMICQAIDKNTVYYYEDICYLFAPASEDNINALKVDNDWGQALNQSKMSNRPINISFDLYLVTESVLDYKTVKDTFCQANGIAQSQIQNMVLLDVDPTGQELFYVALKTDATVEKYLLICDLSYNVSSYKIDGSIEDLECVSLFKANNGWCYGDKID